MAPAAPPPGSSLEAAEPGGAVTCSDLYPAAQVALNHLGHGGEI